MSEEEIWYHDNEEMLIPYDSLSENLSPFIVEAIVRVDSQVFGLICSFPYAFISATIASSIVILILVQITLKTLIVATGSFTAANITAFVFGRRLGMRMEQWHLYLLLEHRKGKLKNSVRKDIESETLMPKSHQNQIDTENDGQSRIRPILKERQRNCSFKITFIIILIIANVLGMLIGGLVAANLPSRLRNNTQPWVDDYYKVHLLPTTTTIITLTLVKIM